MPTVCCKFNNQSSVLQHYHLFQDKKKKKFQKRNDFDIDDRYYYTSTEKNSRKEYNSLS